MDIFDKLRFDPDVLEQQLAFIKVKYERAQNADFYMDTANAYANQIIDLQKAVNKLEEALNNLSPTVAASICAPFEADESPLSDFREGIWRMKELGEIPVNVYSTTGKKTHKSTLVKNRFIFDVAKLYRDQTGKQPTIIIDPYAGNEKKGDFVDLLIACADELEIETKGLISSAQELRSRDVI